MKPKVGLLLLSLELVTCLSAPGNPARSHVPTHAKSNTSPKIHLVIVGVPTFSIDKYKKSLLGDDIVRACGEILQFFKDRFPGDQLVVHPNAHNPCTADATTSPKIRHLLYVDLPSFGKGTLTFVFMMSHGEAVEYPGNKFLERDLRFITSDTTEAARDEKSISIGFEVLTWLQKVSPGSTVLYFIDTCTAGAADTLKLALEKSMLDFQGLRTGLIVSSLRGQTAYSASFTRAFLKIWKEEECPKGKIEDALHDRMATLVRKDLATFEGDSKILIDYKGGWCFNQLGASGRLLFLYQGDKEDVSWTITRIEDPGHFTPRTRKSHGDSFDLEILPPGHYNVTAEVPNEPAKPFGPIDLETRSTVPIFFDVPDTPSKVQSAINAWTSHARFKGVSESDAAILDSADTLAAASAYGTENATGTDDSFSEILTKTQRNHRALVRLGEHLMRHGQLAYASTAFNQAATVANDPKIEADTAKAAYYLAAAAGSVKQAVSIRESFQLGFGPEDSTLRGAEGAALGPPEGGGDLQLKALGTVSILTNQPHLITDDLSAGVENEDKLVALEAPNNRRLIALAGQDEMKPPEFQGPNEKRLEAVTSQLKQTQQSIQQDMASLKDRLAQNEKANTDLQADLKVVTDKLKVTQGQQRKARSAKLNDETDDKMSALATSVHAELATKADTDDVKSVDTKVVGVRTDLDTTREDLKMAKSEMGTLIARNQDEIYQLRRMGVRDYYEFTVRIGQGPLGVGPVQLELLKAYPKEAEFTVRVITQESTSVKKHRSVLEPIFLGLRRCCQRPLELVVLKVSAKDITGYLSVPKDTSFAPVP